MSNFSFNDLPSMDAVKDLTQLHMERGYLILEGPNPERTKSGVIIPKGSAMNDAMIKTFMKVIHAAPDVEHLKGKLVVVSPSPNAYGRQYRYQDKVIIFIGHNSLIALADPENVNQD
jgi:hypothetical protein